MKTKKVAIFTGNRAEYGLQYPIIKAIREQLIVNKYPSENIYGNGDSSKIISKIISSFEFNLNKQFVRNSIN